MENQPTNIASLQNTAPSSYKGAVPPAPVLPKGSMSGNPSPSQQSWGVVISIVVIVGMIIVGAFYAWGKRISEGQVPPTTQTN